MSLLLLLTPYPVTSPRGSAILDGPRERIRFREPRWEPLPEDELDAWVLGLPTEEIV